MIGLLFLFIFFISPLVFFTDLTRNPYVFQNSFVSISILGLLCVYVLKDLKNNTNGFIKTPLQKPILFFVSVCLVSFLCSYFGHAEIFKPSIIKAGINGFLFLLINCVCVFYIAARIKYVCPCNSVKEYKSEYRKLSLFTVIWSALWCLYPLLKTPYHGGGLIGKMLDPYALLLWCMAIVCLYPIAKKTEHDGILKIVISSATVACLYGIFQYFGIEVIWSKLLNPYGNRPVSTFGNPNFISSFAVMLLPLSVYRLMIARVFEEKFFYGLSVFSFVGLLVCSLTRSSWIGALTALIVLFCLAGGNLWQNEAFKKNKKFLCFYFALLILLVFAFPSSNGKFKSEVVNRLAEGISGIKTDSSKAIHDGINYSLYQRLLIYSGAWQMGKENIVLGKGFGQFELFHPFYMGKDIERFPIFKKLRTHANNAHNEILEIWAETGLAGLGIWLWGVIITIRIFLQVKNNPEKQIMLPIAAGLLGMLADNMLNVSLRFCIPVILFWYMLGFYFSVWEGESERDGNVSKLYKFNVFTVIAFSLISVVFFAGVFFREVNYFAGYKELKRGNSVKAADLFLKAMNYNSWDVNNNYELGNVYASLSEYKKAETAFKAAIDANAGYDEPYFNMAVILLRQGKALEALKYAQMSCLINSLNTAVWNVKTQIYIELQKDPEYVANAIKDFNGGIKLFPYEYNMYNSLGYFYGLAGQKDEALKMYARGVRLKPDNAMLVQNFMLAVKNNKNEQDTLLWLKRYNKLNRILGNFNDSSPVSVTQNGLKELNAFISENPDDVKLLELRAKYYFKLGQMQKAAGQMAEILEINPYDDDVRYGLGVIYLNGEEYKKAAAEFNQILKNNPKNQRAIARLQMLKDKV